ncbi:hypothetical protein ACSBR1_025656 [Camellia fascicularis]
MATAGLKPHHRIVILKASCRPKYVVGCHSKVDKEKLTSGTRVVLDMMTLTIMRGLPREILIMSAIPLWVVYLIKSENSWNPLSYLL